MDKEFVVYAHSGKLFSHKKYNLTICSNMDWPTGYYAKINKTEKDKYDMISLICGI